jgi:TIR domain
MSQDHGSDKKNFFVSYTEADRQWAAWVAWQLEEFGYKTFIHEWDVRPGNDFMHEMERALQRCDHVLALLSPDYLEASPFGALERRIALTGDPSGEHRALIPVRVVDCHPEGLLSSRVWIDLVGLAETEAQEALRAGVRKGRARPQTKPTHPGGGRPGTKPEFPGHSSQAAELPEESGAEAVDDRAKRWLHRLMTRRGLAVAGAAALAVLALTASITWPDGTDPVSGGGTSQPSGPTSVATTTAGTAPTTSQDSSDGAALVPFCRDLQKYISNYNLIAPKMATNRLQGKDVAFIVGYAAALERDARAAPSQIEADSSLVHEVWRQFQQGLSKDPLSNSVLTFQTVSSPPSMQAHERLETFRKQSCLDAAGQPR